MRLGRPSEGDAAWLVLATYVAVYDAWAMRHGKETLSASYAKALASPARRWPTIMFHAMIVAHLQKVLPPKWDPLRRWTWLG